MNASVRGIALASNNYNTPRYYVTVHMRYGVFELVITWYIPYICDVHESTVSFF